MNDLKKMNFTELDSSEMKQVQGGGLVRRLVKKSDVLGTVWIAANSLDDVVDIGSDGVEILDIKVL
ncbi:hypothetical protein Q1W71_20410 [Flavobacterium pectinovorum]|uniref:hypothetical protein n=1 Tax=Flavobacterium pectinovorum TaxID=29533 RepID=UPI00265F91F1|nr:hypothetical protein [Flavobacterium pectinovorum]WKL47312.1 hypothetical protein Q1W71_20410 [Flavobacterium pectinovorum]